MTMRRSAMRDIPPTSEPIQPLAGVEFVLEGLHLGKRLNNEDSRARPSTADVAEQSVRVTMQR